MAQVEMRRSSHLLSQSSVAHSLVVDRSTAEAPNLVDVLRARAQSTPSRIGFTLLGDGERVSATVTYAELDRSAQVVAAVLQAHGATGERVLLVLADHASFLPGFLGCLYAGAVAVPTHAGFSQSRDQVRAIAHDARPHVVLTNRAVRERAASFLAAAPELAAVPWIVVDELPADAYQDWRLPVIDATTLALLQYTSGSTGDPKGVMVTHGHLTRNSECVRWMLPLHEGSVALSWLPVYHDMGLMGGVLQPIYTGAPCVLMPAAAFVQRPARWLEAIGRYGVTATGGPNFAFDLCVERVSAAEREALDLRSWEVAVCAAEPVAAGTLERFAATFEACGFRREVFSPAYGLAEATLVVTSTLPSQAPAVLHLDAERLREGAAVAAVEGAPALAVVGCGVAMPGLEVAIVDPVSRVERAVAEVGEIWVRGGNVVSGYWQRPRESEAQLGARLAHDAGREFLRTGDLGFVTDGALFVVGRLTDLMIVRGRNHSPRDVERTAEEAHPGLARNASAAFLAQVEGAERLVIVAEATRRHGAPDAPAVAAAVRAAVAAVHGLELHAFTLLVPHGLPRTTSGKVRRRAARAEFAAGTLRALGTWTRVTARPASGMLLEGGLAPSAALIEAWLIARTAALLGVETSEIDVHAPATELGLGSQEAVALAGALAEWLGGPLPATLLYDGAPTLHSLAVMLSGEANEEDESGARRPPVDAISGEEARRLLLDVDRLSPAEIERLLHAMAAAPRREH